MKGTKQHLENMLSLNVSTQLSQCQETMGLDQGR